MTHTEKDEEQRVVRQGALLMRETELVARLNRAHERLYDDLRTGFAALAAEMAEAGVPLERAVAEAGRLNGNMLAFADIEIRDHYPRAARP